MPKARTKEIAGCRIEWLSKEHHGVSCRWVDWGLCVGGAQKTTHRNTLFATLLVELSLGLVVVDEGDLHFLRHPFSSDQSI